MKRTAAPKIEVLPYSDLWSLLDRAAFTVARLRELELARLNLTIEQASILHILHHKGSSITIEELEDITMRQPHSVSTLINRMVTAGLLKREKNKESKRFSISITREGNLALDKLTFDSLEVAFSTISAPEKIQLNLCLDKLLEKCRLLLGISSLPPFLMYANSPNLTSNVVRTSNLNGSVSDYEIWASTNRTRFAIARLRELELAHFNLTIEQTSILHIIRNHGAPMTIEELQDITMRQPHSISTLVNRMIAAGLLIKEKKPENKRHLISITLKGQNLHHGLTMISLEMTFSVLTARETLQFTTILTRLLEKNRQLLGVSSHPVFMQYLNQERTPVRDQPSAT